MLRGPLNTGVKLQRMFRYQQQNKNGIRIASNGDFCKYIPCSLGSKYITSRLYQRHVRWTAKRTQPRLVVYWLIKG